jgi:ABC-type transport system involved in multi-copper enzyme maturation permease subunit
LFTTLFRKEIREHLLTFRFGAALITTFVLVIVSVWVLGEDFVVKNNNFNRMSESFSEENGKVYVPSQIAPVVLRPLSPLSIFAKGEDEQLGNAVRISRWSVPVDADDYLTVNDLLHSIPSFDLLTIFVFAISLFGILLSYDSICGERERGTLKMLCSNNTKRGVIFTAKFAGGAVILAVPFLISLISALLVLQFVHGIRFSATQWAAIGLITVLGLLYGAVFIGLGMVCSALAGRSSVALALALLLWTLSVILIPSAGNSVASMIIPLESTAGISKFVQESGSEIGKKESEFITENNIDLSSNGSSNIGGEQPYWFDGELPWLLDHMKYIGFYEQLYQEQADQLWKLYQGYLARKKEQYKLGSLLKLISPAHLLRHSVTALAYTDYATHADFLEHCRRYRQAILDDFRNKGLFDKNIHRFFTRYELSDFASEEMIEQREQERQRREEAGDEFASRIEGFGPLPKDYIPAFDYAGGGPNFEESIQPLALLALMIIGVFALGFAAFISYDVR